MAADEKTDVPVEATASHVAAPKGSEAHGAGEASTALQIERDMSMRNTFRFWPKAIFFSFMLSLAIIMEAYDLNLMSNFYPFPAFKNRFGDEVDPDGGMLVSARWQTIINNGVQAGSIIGLLINGYVTEWFGYRKTMIGAMFFMIGGIFIPFFSTGLPMFLAGALVQGLPWGVFQTLSVTYAADLCPTKLRQYMTSYVNICWVVGGILAKGMLKGLMQRTDQWGYRIPFALQWIWPGPIIIAAIFVPESPWWLIRKGRYDEARKAVERLTSPSSGVHFDLDAHMEMMKATNQLEMEMSTGGNFWDCFRGVDLRRTEIACVVWLTQAFCGVPFMSYGIQFLINAGMSPDNAFTMGLVENCIGLIGCLLAWWIMNYVGRRSLYLYGLSAMFVILMIIGFMGIPTGKENEERLGWGIGALIITMLFLFQLSVGPSCYCLVAEIPSTRLRVKTVALARATYNLAGFITNALMPPMIGKNDWAWGAKAAFFWAGIDVIFLCWVFFRLPEPFGLTYSEIDLLFEHKVSARGFSQEKADALKPELDELARRTEKNVQEEL
ncbi:hypothetical protein PoMZ_00389 [Pyricularia oryzae]|uniref:Major facilitator superfamily (MFS) profile domain-containing protein n=1 Tax=Pyricularia oryzae TaxID=318829 RepID=A0A4P7N3B0_PYROR|nr:hypothetical protein PoMZ_00389 [Pyricularia oryzae]